jgi:hypothetical protein
MNGGRQAEYSSWGGVEMTRTRLSPLSVLYMEVVLTTPNRKNISHSHFSSPYLNMYMRY